MKGSLTVRSRRLKVTGKGKGRKLECRGVPGKKNARARVLGGRGEKISPGGALVQVGVNKDMVDTTDARERRC